MIILKATITLTVIIVMIFLAREVIITITIGMVSKVYHYPIARYLDSLVCAKAATLRSGGYDAANGRGLPGPKKYTKQWPKHYNPGSCLKSCLLLAASVSILLL